MPCNVFLVQVQKRVLTGREECDARWGKVDMLVGELSSIYFFHTDFRPLKTHPGDGRLGRGCLPRAVRRCFVSYYIASILLVTSAVLP